jgi:hypothetical protein
VLSFVTGPGDIDLAIGHFHFDIWVNLLLQGTFGAFHRDNIFIRNTDLYSRGEAYR